MALKERKSGIEIWGDVPWGNHFCLFYQTKEDLIDILVPYFKEGLENNEYCMWVTSEPLTKKDAEKAIRSAIPNFKQYLKKNQIEIIPHTEWYLKDNEFNLQRVLNAWVDKLNHALDQGYEGMRVTGNTTWLEKKEWNVFMEYEEEINNFIPDHNMNAICTYQLEKCGPFEIIDVIRNHQFALIRREGEWEQVKSMEQVKSEQRLKDSEEKFRQITEQALMGIAILQDDVFKYINNQFAEIYGYSVEELTNWPSGEYIKLTHPEDRDFAMEQAKNKQIGLEDVVPQYQFRGIKKSGETIWLEILSKTISHEGNSADLIAIVDITEHKKADQKLEESEKKHRLITENANDLIGILNRKFEYEYINKQTFIQVLGYTDKDLIGKSVLHFVHPKDLNYAVNKLKEGFKLGIGSAEVRFKHKKGYWVWIESKGKVFTDTDGDLKILIVSRDITNRKLAEQKLKESEKGYRTAYERANFYKDLFAHDMNNILSNIMANVQLYTMYQRYPEKWKDPFILMNSIGDQGLKGKILIKNVEKLSKLEGAEISLESIEVINVLNKAVNFIYDGFHDRKINIHVNVHDEEFYVQANELLFDVFENILRNAVRYTDNIPVEILVRISRVQKENKKVLKIEFIDNGIGIPNNRKKIIFERGYKSEKKTRGMGFGLSLAKRIIESYRGEIRIEDKVKGDYTKGSNFILLIPEII